MDLNRVATLLHCADLLVQWPNLAKINSVVMGELQDINDDPATQKALEDRAKAKEPKPEPKPAPQPRAIPAENLHPQPIEPTQPTEPIERKI